MSMTPPPLPPKVRFFAVLRNLIFVGVFAGLVGFSISQLWRSSHPPKVTVVEDGAADVAKRVDGEFAAFWKDEEITPVEKADDLTVMRRLSLALTGAGPSVEEIRHFESQPGESSIAWWTNFLLNDRRTTSYLAERFARAFVGTENGPFIVYRRNRLVRWLDDQLYANRPYNELVYDLIAAEGIWTTNPEANFLTATIDQNNQKEGPDQIKLAARTTRAFLGVRIDCVQCHDDMFGDRWKQQDFHQLAAFFSQAKMGVTGVQENPKLEHTVRYRGETEEVPVSAEAPFLPELMPGEGKSRERLAAWVTHVENEAFSRAAVNRVWALMFNQPLIDPIDNIPLEGPYPSGMETLAEDFVENGYDLHRLIRIMAETNVFQLDSSSNRNENPIAPEHESKWAVFPMTPLRPEQVAESVIQASTLSSLDAESHIIERLREFAETNEFVKRYGDLGEDEFGVQTGTVPQRLLMMNGKLVRERTKENPVMNASTRIGFLTRVDATAVETAYLAVLSRRPTEAESEHFEALLAGKKGAPRFRTMEDIYWTLINSTEFTWNH